MPWRSRSPIAITLGTLLPDIAVAGQVVYVALSRRPKTTRLRKGEDVN